MLGATSLMETLELRRMYSATPAVHHRPSLPDGLSPAQVRHAYQFDRIQFRSHKRTIAGDGSGQTIAIVDAFSAPTITADLKTFDATYGLADTDSIGNFALSIATPGGKPRADGAWASEISLDVEWAHAIAPAAHILLVEATSDDTSDLLTALDYARRQSGVVAVSMSWGGDSPFDSSNDSVLTTPKRHIGGSGLGGGVTFVTSAGDTSGIGQWPATSPNVLVVGGTSLTTDASGNWESESAWSGNGVNSHRHTGATPDVAYNADPNTGYAVYDSTDDGNGDIGWGVVGGTSAGAPQWAALMAIADQGRSYNGLGSLDGPTQSMAAIYKMPQSDFRDITTGSNGSPATHGYDLATGRGTPLADQIVSFLYSYNSYGTNSRP